MDPPAYRSAAGNRFWHDTDRRRATLADPARLRQTRRVAALGFFLAAVLPVYFWHEVIGDVASDLKLDVGYLAGWTPWVLIGLGLVFLAPVAWSAGRDPESRWYPKARNAYAGWGLTLYLCGCGLATQVAQMNNSLLP